LRLNGGLVRHQQKASLVQLFEQKLLHMETGKQAISLIREDLCGIRSSSTTYLADVLQLIKIANQLAVAAILAGSASKKMLNEPFASAAALQASMHMIIRISRRGGHAT